MGLMRSSQNCFQTCAPPYTPFCHGWRQAAGERKATALVVRTRLLARVEQEHVTSHVGEDLTPGPIDIHNEAEIICSRSSRGSLEKPRTLPKRFCGRGEGLHEEDHSNSAAG